ncbi:MAG TPA: hypothetical protein VFV80_14105 [Geminicoccaceae bacterium]|nr:hypothetical protein [Geminicoccaceae bacterium]
MDARGRLEAWIAREIAQPAHPAALALAAAIRTRHGAIAAVLFYGSCLRQPAAAAAPPDGILDFYVVVDRYRDAYPGRLLALANAVLPPNVFHVATAWRDEPVRGKYAVISMAQFRRGLSQESLQTSLWARFAQPCRLVWARDAEMRAAIGAALADAVVTMVAATAPLLEPGFDAERLWLRGFRETYRAELRTEGAARAREIYDSGRERYDAITPWALAVAATARRRNARIRWVGRRLLGKALSVLRLTKSAFTFDGGVDYILWKIERHSGVRLPVSPWQRRHPLLASPLFLWRLYRLGAIR